MNRPSKRITAADWLQFAALMAGILFWGAVCTVILWAGALLIHAAFR